MNNIASERVRMDMTQEDLAQKIGKSKRTISKWETGKQKPRIDDVAKMCSVFGCSSDYLIGLSDERKS